MSSNEYIKIIITSGVMLSLVISVFGYWDILVQRMKEESKQMFVSKWDGKSLIDTSLLTEVKE